MINKEMVLKKICVFHAYEFKEENGKIVLDNGCSDYKLAFENVKSECGHFEYEDIDEALKDWLPTLEQEADDTLSEFGYKMWNYEIKFIEELE